MEYFVCENEECRAVYFTDAHEGFRCTCCSAGISKMSDDQAFEYFNEITAWNVDHPTVSC